MRKGGFRNQTLDQSCRKNSVDRHPACGNAFDEVGRRVLLEALGEGQISRAVTVIEAVEHLESGEL